MVKVFAFWEPREKVPGYIRACMRTWSFIPDSEIVLLDFASLRNWLTQDEIDSVTCHRLSLPKQADCYRALLLEKYGGIWLDADTIVTPAIGASGWLRSSDTEVVAFGERPASGKLKDVRLNGGFINACVPHAALMKSWASVLPSRIELFARYSGNLLLRIFKRKVWRRCRGFAYCLNDILNPLVLETRDRELRLLNAVEGGVFPEIRRGIPDGNRLKAYQEYYFAPGEIDEGLGAAKGIIMLHNSWTPEKYLQMSEEEFLKTDTRLAAMLNRLLDGVR